MIIFHLLCQTILLCISSDYYYFFCLKTGKMNNVQKQFARLLDCLYGNEMILCYRFLFFLSYMKRLIDFVIAVLISKSKLVEKQPDSTSDWHVETLKIEIIKIRRENEILKQKLLHSKEG